MEKEKIKFEDWERSLLDEGIIADFDKSRRTIKLSLLTSIAARDFKEGAIDRIEDAIPIRKMPAGEIVVEGQPRLNVHIDKAGYRLYSLSISTGESPAISEQFAMEDPGIAEDIALLKRIRAIVAPQARESGKKPFKPRV